MSTEDFIFGLFCRVGDQMRDVRKHPQAKLYPSDTITLVLLFALKGVSERVCDRWITRDLRPLFPQLPDRTRLFRLMAAHQDRIERFLAELTVLGVADTFAWR